MTLSNVVLLLLLAESQPASVVVMPLKADSIKAGALAALNELLAVEITQQSRFRVITPDDLEAELGRANMQETLGCDAIACAAEIGGALGARYLLAGSARRLGGNLIITLSFIDTETRDARRGKSIIKNQEALYPQAIENALREIISGPTSGSTPVGSAAQSGGGEVASPPPTTTTTSMLAANATAAPVSVARSRFADERDERLEEMRTSLLTKLWPTLIAEPTARDRDVAYRMSSAAKEDAKILHEVLAERARRRVPETTSSDDAKERFTEKLRACRATPASAADCVEAGDVGLGYPEAGSVFRPGGLYAEACRAGNEVGCGRGRELAAAFRLGAGGESGGIVADLCLAGDHASCDVIEPGLASGWVDKFKTACARIADGRPAGPRDDFACYMLLKKDENRAPNSSKRFGGAVLMGMGGLAVLVGAAVGAIGLNDQQYIIPTDFPPSFEAYWDYHEEVEITGFSVAGGGLLMAVAGLLLFLFDEGPIPGAEEVGKAYRAKVSADQAAPAPGQAPPQRGELLIPVQAEFRGLALAVAF